MLDIPDDIIARHSDLKPTYKRVYWILRDCLLEDNLKPQGDGKFTEELIAKALDVSRTPVRTALAQLKNEGFIQNKSRSRVGISEFSIEDKSSLIEVAAVLEGAAAALAAQRATSDDIEMLIEMNGSIRQYMRAGENNGGLRGVRDLHSAFHLMIGKLSGNKYLYKYIVEVRNMMRMLSAENSVDETTYPERVAPVHDGIIDALQRGDVDSARVYMTADILNARSIYLRGTTE